MNTVKLILFWSAAGLVLSLAASYPQQTLAISSVIAIWMYIDRHPSQLPKETK